MAGVFSSERVLNSLIKCQSRHIGLVRSRKAILSTNQIRIDKRVLVTRGFPRLFLLRAIIGSYYSLSDWPLWWIFFFFAILKREALKFLPDADVGFYVPVSSNSRKTYKNSSIPVCKSGFNTQRISQQGEVILRNVTNLKGKEKTRESCNDFACQLFWKVFPHHNHPAWRWFQKVVEAFNNLLKSSGVWRVGSLWKERDFWLTKLWNSV